MQLDLQPPEQPPFNVPDISHIGDLSREVVRRNVATAAAERRTVAALEALLHEAVANKSGNARMLWRARVAGVAGIIATILTVVVPMAQIYFAR